MYYAQMIRHVEFLLRLFSSGEWAESSKALSGVSRVATVQMQQIRIFACLVSHMEVLSYILRIVIARRFIETVID